MFKHFPRTFIWFWWWCTFHYCKSRFIFEEHVGFISFPSILSKSKNIMGTYPQDIQEGCPSYADFLNVNPPCWYLLLGVVFKQRDATSICFLSLFHHERGNPEGFQSSRAEEGEHPCMVNTIGNTGQPKLLPSWELTRSNISLFPFGTFESMIFWLSGLVGWMWTLPGSFW